MNVPPNFTNFFMDDGVHAYTYVHDIVWYSLDRQRPAQCTNTRDQPHDYLLVKNPRCIIIVNL